jgi:hypothetical protein
MLGAFVGLGDSSFHEWNDTLTMMGLLLNASQPVFVRHGAGGLVAKALAMQFDKVGIAFEAPDLMTSALDQTVVPGSQGKRLSVNIDSVDSLFALNEDGATENIRVPTWGRSWFGRSNPYEMFCRLAAACVSDDTFDHLCRGSRAWHVQAVLRTVGGDRFA